MIITDPVTEEYTDDRIHSIARQFNERTIPADRWVHETHLVVALWFLDQFSFYDAYCRMRAGIIMLNYAHNTPNTEDRGYHETLTWFWLSVLHMWTTMHPGFDLAGRCNALLRSRIADKSFPRRFYTTDDISNPANRAVVLKPSQRDLTQEVLSELLRG